MPQPRIIARPDRAFAPAAAAAAIALILVATPALAQQSDREWLEDCREEERWDERAVHCEVRPVQVATTGSLGIEGTNGPMRVTGESTRTVAVRARVQVWGDTEREAREDADEVEIVVDGDRVRADVPGGIDYSVGFVATVPHEYDVDLSVANGPMNVEGVRGRVDVRAANGPLELRDVAGAVNARTVNGPLTVHIADGALSGVDVETTNGPLTLRLPTNLDARLEASTGNGPLSTSGLDVQIDRPRFGPGGTIDATLGAGGPLIRARTANGPLSIRG